MSNPRKPHHIKIIEGTFRRDRANPNEPDYEIEIPSCPSQLSPQAKAEWYRIAPLLESMGLIAKVNRASFAAYCSLYARWILAEQMIAKEGAVIRFPVNEVRCASEGDSILGRPGRDEGKTTKVIYELRKNPWVDISLKCAAEMRRYANEFGLTPASRGKVSAVSATPKKKQEKSERFFK